MSAKTNAVSYPPNRTDSMIGAGARVDGRVTFTGVLRVQGEIKGDINCQADSRDALVVDASGSVTGTVTAPHVIVKGKVAGPLASTQTVEVFQGAHIAGDIVYRHLDVHSGGVINGMMTPSARTAEEAAAEVGHRASESLETPAINEFGAPTGDRQAVGERFRFLLKPALAIIAAAIGVFTFWPKSDGIKPVATDHKAQSGELRTDVGLKADTMHQSVAKPPTNEPVKSEESTPAPSEQAPRGADPVVTAEQAVSGESQVTAGSSRYVAVTGVNPAKPTGVFLLVSKEPSVLYKKKLDDSSQGQRIEMAAGEKVSVSISGDELLRVAKGRDVSIFYQGRKVQPKTVEGGGWIKFVPHPASRDRDSRPEVLP